MSDNRLPLTDAEAAAYLDTLDHLYGRLPSIESRAETLLADARSVGDDEAVVRIEAVLNRLRRRFGAGLETSRRRFGAGWLPAWATSGRRRG
jgi:hypothetical protein